MDIYIDKSNLINIFKNSDHPLFGDVIKVMKNQLDVKFNFSSEQAESDEVLSILLLEFTSGIATNHQFLTSIYPDRPLKSNFHATHSDRQSVFLLDDERIHLCKDKKGLLIFGIGEEFTCFNTLFLLQDDYLFEKSFNIRKEAFCNWKKISGFAYPFTDFILIDNFIFSLPDLVKFNLFQILETLCSGKEISINIVIFTRKDKVFSSIDELQKEIKHLICRITGRNGSCTIITWRDQRGISSLAEHDRCIFTNYLEFCSGDSFNYWDHTGKKITKGRKLVILSLAKKENFEQAIELIDDLNTYIAGCNQQNITGDKKSNFLKFNP